VPDRPATPPAAPGAGVQLVATDLDGTLLTPGGLISPRTAEAVRAARAAGIHVVPATGRPPKSVWDLARAGGLGPLGVCSNGAALVDLAEEIVLESDHFSPAEATDLVHRTRSAAPGAHFAVDDLEWFTHEAGFFEMAVDWDEQIAVVDDILTALGRGPIKLIARCPGTSAVALIDRLAPVLGTDADLTTSGLDWVDVGVPLVSKASSLARVCERLGVDAQRVVAVGDNHNDLPMLVWAGTAMAVANAVPAALAVADRVLPANADHGVAVLLEELVDAASSRPAPSPEPKPPAGR
jgi:Cof subfamily protein (haloacid dehalogenase superfamily)